MADKKPRGPVYVQVQLSPDERKAVDAAAGTARLPRSTWMRLVCVDAARRGAVPMIPSTSTP